MDQIHSNESLTLVMDSFFDCIDNQVNQISKFWKKDLQNLQTLELKKDCSGCLNVKNKHGEAKTRYFYLVDSKLFYCKSPETPGKKFVVVSWKTLKFFTFPEEKSSFCCKQISRKDLKSVKFYDFFIRLGTSDLFQDFHFLSSDDLEMWTSCLAPKTILQMIDEDFSIVKEIGYGKHSTVSQAFDLSTSKQYSIKAINKQDFQETFRTHESLANEISIMRKISHPNIVSLYFIYENPSHIFFILDLMSGGDLFHRIIMKNRFSESVSSKLTQNLLSALNYLHGLEVIYRDLKPQNILFDTEDCDVSVKISNFYLACDVSDSQDFRCGSPGYVAPEILKKKPYSKKVDIFSAGVILYTLLSGRAPFVGKKPGEIFLKNKECKIYFQDAYWKNVSKEGVDCVLKLTDPDPEFRPTAAEALNHNWFKVELSTRVFSPVLPPPPADTGISAELMKRMNRARGSEENKKKDEDLPISEAQRKALNNNSKNFLSRLRGFDSLLKN